MSKRITVHEEGTPIYDIIIDESFQSLNTEMINFNIANKKVCIVTDSNVSPLYMSHLKELFQSTVKQLIVFEFPAGEKSKTLDTVRLLYEKLILNKFDRNDMLIALGGGVVGDLTGYTAATYLRGIDFIQIPTTLLSQVDSSIGGKTGVDFDSYKNMVGAFYQPKLVYINLMTLKSLPKREYLSGMGEIIKHGLIKDAMYFNWIIDHHKSIQNLDYDTLEKMIEISCNIKRVVVEEDPKEKGPRAFLNFGHTIGHAVEKLVDFNLLHGECVSIGIVAASYLSYLKHYITKGEFDKIVTCLRKFELPISIHDLSTDDIIEATLHDKKMDSGTIKFVLLESIGNAVIVKSVTTDDMKQSINLLKELVS